MLPCYIFSERNWLNGVFKNERDMYRSMQIHMGTPLFLRLLLWPRPRHWRPWDTCPPRLPPPDFQPPHTYKDPGCAADSFGVWLFRWKTYWGITDLFFTFWDSTEVIKYKITGAERRRRARLLHGKITDTFNWKEANNHIELLILILDIISGLTHHSDDINGIYKRTYLSLRLADCTMINSRWRVHVYMLS